jgi:3-mercaptopyruvate sulfurtransferase SseA
VGRELLGLGYTKVKVLKGGWREWGRLGYPSDDKK